MSAQIADKRLWGKLVPGQGETKRTGPVGDKMDWSNEVRSSRVPRIGGASEWRMGQ